MERIKSEAPASWGDRNQQYHDEAMPDYTIENKTLTPEEQARAEEAAKNAAADAIFKAQTQNNYHIPRTAPIPSTPVATTLSETPSRKEGSTFDQPAPVRENRTIPSSGFTGFLKKLIGR